MKLGKFSIFFLLMALAACAAAIFGALHNQLSYTVGPDYFHSLKFTQFAIPPEMSPRLGAAWVGVQVSWWMGAADALPSFAYGLLSVPNAQSYLAAGIGAIGLVIMLATMAAFAGLIDGLIADPTGLLDASLPRPRARIAPISCALVSCMRRLMSRGPWARLWRFGRSGAHAGLTCAGRADPMETLRRPAGPRDCDILGHMNVAAYIDAVSDAMFALQTAVGLDGAAMARTQRSFVAAHIAADYKAEMLAGDVFTLHSHVQHLGAKSARFAHRMSRMSDRATVFQAENTAVFFDLAARRGDPR